MRRPDILIIPHVRALLQGFFHAFRAFRAFRARGTAHDRQWRAHPAVKTGDELTLGERAADGMRGALGTWTFLFTLAGIMALWVVTAGFGHDQFPYILLNLILSTLAGVQAAVLLIAAKRADQIAAATALHTLDNTERLKALIEQNTALTEQVADLARAIHAQTLTQTAAATQAATPPSSPARTATPSRRRRSAS